MNIITTNTTFIIIICRPTGQRHLGTSYCAQHGSYKTMVRFSSPPCPQTIVFSHNKKVFEISSHIPYIRYNWWLTVIGMDVLGYVRANIQISGYCIQPYSSDAPVSVDLHGNVNGPPTTTLLSPGEFKVRIINFLYRMDSLRAHLQILTYIHTCLWITWWVRSRWLPTLSSEDRCQPLW